MAIPITFRKSQEKAIVTYNYADISDGTGIVVLFGVIRASSAGTTYNLTTSTAPGRGVTTNAVLNDATTFSLDLGSFNTPKTAKGTATFIAEMNKTGGNLTVTVTIQHIDGVTNAVTPISSAIQSSDGTVDGYIFNFNLPLTEKHFKIGDKLRCKVVIPETGGSRLWIDPTRTQPLRLLMPFRINL